MTYKSVIQAVVFCCELKREAERQQSPELLLEAAEEMDDCVSLLRASRLFVAANRHERTAHDLRKRAAILQRGKIA